ncbi:MAG: hypothetical protein IJP92_10940 [Lachnospiraceae bacterium]|nr:hypothetical protein [Lachnospiraceae bacterium]
MQLLKKKSRVPCAVCGRELKEDQIYFAAEDGALCESCFDSTGFTGKPEGLGIADIRMIGKTVSDSTRANINIFHPTGIARGFADLCVDAKNRLIRCNDRGDRPTQKKGLILPLDNLLNYYAIKFYGLESYTEKSLSGGGSLIAGLAGFGLGFLGMVGTNNILSEETKTRYACVRSTVQLFFQIEGILFSYEVDGDVDQSGLEMLDRALRLRNPKKIHPVIKPSVPLHPTVDSFDQYPFYREEDYRKSLENFKRKPSPDIMACFWSNKHPHILEVHTCEICYYEKNISEPQSGGVILHGREALAVSPDRILWVVRDKNAWNKGGEVDPVSTFQSDIPAWMHYHLA